MVLDTASASLALNVQLPGREFVEGSVIEATVRGVAGRDLTVTSGEVTLIRTITYRYRYVGYHGSYTTASARSADVVTRQVLPTSGRYAAGQQLMEPVTLAVPADGPGSVTADLVQIEWAVGAHLQVDGSPDIEVKRRIVVLSRAVDRASVEQNTPLVVDRGYAFLALESLSSRRLVPGLVTGGRTHRGPATTRICPRGAGRTRSPRAGPPWPMDR